METLLGMCVQGTLMITVVLVVRIAVRRWASPLVFPFVWGVVLVRLLVPFSATSPLLGRVFVEPASNYVVDVAGAAVVSQAGFKGIADLVGLVQTEGIGPAGEGASTAWAHAVVDWVPVVWLVGTVVVALAYAALYAFGFVRLSRGVLTQDARLLRWARLNGPRRGLRIRESSTVASPVTYGVIRPVVVVPSGYADAMPWPVVELALRHELAHVRSFDVLFKAALGCAACLFWFNPLVWAMYACANRDIELCRDEQTLRGCSRRERAGYASMLVDAWAHRTNVPGVAGFAMLAIERRVASIVRNKAPRALVAAACLLFAVTPLGTLAIASAVAPVRAGCPVTLRVDNGIYAFELPSRWTDYVSVRAEGMNTWVYLTEYPDVWLMRFDVVGEYRNVESTTGCALLYEEELRPSVGAEVGAGFNSRYYLQVWGVNYLNLSRGDLWRTSYTANPAYPGEDGEEQAVALCTGWRLDAETVRAMSVNPPDNMEGFDYYLESVIPTVEVRQGGLMVQAEE